MEYNLNYIYSKTYNYVYLRAKSILGRYLRKRLDVPIDYLITMNDLKRYGRDNVTLSLIEEGVYYADFSV